MKTEQQLSTTDSTAPRKPNKLNQWLQTLIRLFRASDLKGFRPLGSGITFAIKVAGGVPEECSTFPLFFAVKDSTLTLRIFFSRKNSAHSFEKSQSYKLLSYIEEVNKTCKAGKFELEKSRMLVTFRSCISVHKSKTQERDLIRFVNSCTTVYVKHVQCWSDFANGKNTPVGRNLNDGEEMCVLKTQQKDFYEEEKAIMGLKQTASPLVEVDFDGELKIQKSLSNLESNRFFTWESIELNEESASAKFSANTNSISLDCFLANFPSADVLTQLQFLTETLSRERVMIDDLYERLIIVDGRLKINPVALAGKLRICKCSYAALWSSLLQCSSERLQKQREVLSHSSLWSRMDCYWKIECSSLYPLEQSQSGLTGRLGTETVLLDPVPSNTCADELMPVLDSELRNCLGITALQSPETGDIVCFFVKRL